MYHLGLIFFGLIQTLKKTFLFYFFWQHHYPVRQQLFPASHTDIMYQISFTVKHQEKVVKLFGEEGGEILLALSVYDFTNILLSRTIEECLAESICFEEKTDLKLNNDSNSVHRKPISEFYINVLPYTLPRIELLTDEINSAVTLLNILQLNCALSFLCR